MKSATLIAFSLASLLSACTSLDATEPIPGKADDPNKRSCQDEGSYGDGTCDLDCVVPDIDCFTVFEDDQSIAEIYERRISPHVDGMPRLPVSDARFQRLNALLAEGWDAYSSANAVGELPRPALVVVDDTEFPSANAFVVREQTTVAWLVAIHASFVVRHTDDMIIGTIFHELEHAAGLHLLGDVGTDIRRFYTVADGGQEELGFRQASDPVLAEHGNRWIGASELVGGYAPAELGGVPLSGSVLGKVLTSLLEGTAACEAASFDYGELEFVFAEHPAFGELINPLSPAVVENVATISTALRSQTESCLDGDSRELLEIMAEVFGVDVEFVREQLDSEQLEVIRGKPLAEQLFALGGLGQQQMRSAETAILSERGVGLSQVRYYSDEEAADDSAARTLHAASRSVAAFGESFFLDLGADADACRDRLEMGTVPYGNLSDTHHGTCWRIGHARQMAELLEAY